MGKTGLKEIATQNFQKAHYLKSELSKIPGYKIINTKPTYNEFLLRCPDIDLLIYQCKQRNLLPPLNISKYYPKMKNIALVCVTEMNSRESIENFLQAAHEAITNTKEGDK